MSVTNVINDTLSVSYTGNGKAVTAPVGSYTGTEAISIETVIPAGATAQHIVIPTVDVSALQSTILSSDQDITVKTNSSTTPIETLTIKKTKALLWTVDDATACPFSTDLTSFYVANPGLTDAKFHFRALVS